MHHLSIRIRIFAAASLALGFCGCSTIPAAKRDIAPQADAILKAMSDKLGSAKHLSLQATRTIDPALVAGTEVKQSAQLVMAVSRPNRLRGSSRDQEGLREIIYNGSEFTIWDKGSNHYATVSAPATIDACVDEIGDKWGFTPPLADLLVADVYSSLTEQVDTGRLVGTGSIRGTTCDHLAFSQANLDWEVWVAQDDKLPRRFVITHTAINGNPQVRGDITSWDLRTTHSANYYNPSLDDAIKIEMIPND